MESNQRNANMKDFYEEYWLYRQKEGYIYDEKNVAPRYQIILSLVRKNKDVLDVGCGEGILSKLLITKSNKVVGVDISRKAVELSRKNQVEAYVCDIENEGLPFMKKFDVIVMAEIIEHLISPRNALKKLEKYLKKEGFIIITFPNIGFYRYRLQLLRGRFPQQHLYRKSEHLHYWTLPDFLHFLHSCNLRCAQVNPILSFPFYRILSKVGPCVKIIRKFPNLFAYQVVVKAFPKANCRCKQ